MGPAACSGQHAASSIADAGANGAPEIHKTPPPPNEQQLAQDLDELPLEVPHIFFFPAPWSGSALQFRQRPAGSTCGQERDLGGVI